MVNNKITGDLGEQEICERIPCPNCDKKLMLLPPGFPMYDVQCTRCLFRAQVKTVNKRPTGSIFGAGWDIYEKVTRAGYLSPSLIVNYKWIGKEGKRQVIRFYPFIAKGNLKNYQLSPTARRANYRMFKYVKLDKIPFFELYSNLDPLI